MKELAADGRTVVIAHEAIPNYMDAMTMPFKVKEPGELAGFKPGDKILFRLRVTDTESWVEGISKIGSAPTRGRHPETCRRPGCEHECRSERQPHTAAPLLDYPFTNELGQAVRLSDFRGQALAITFFFTRCPIPDFCPRLSKNFEEASQKLSAMPGGPTNWHFLSVTFDPEFDTPAVLRAYGERYQYDPKHWSFLTGPREKISELASGSDVKFEPAAASSTTISAPSSLTPPAICKWSFPRAGICLTPSLPRSSRPRPCPPDRRGPMRAKLSRGGGACPLNQR